MFKASQIVEGLKDSCGPAGREFVETANEGSLTRMVNHPAFRRIDWDSSQMGPVGEIPSLVSEDPGDIDQYSAEVFEWSYRLWRGVLGGQIAAIIGKGETVDLREGYPWVLGYVRAVGETLIEEADFGHHQLLSRFIRVAVWADVFGLDRVDEIDGFFNAVDEGIVPEDMIDEYASGVDRGVADVRMFLDHGRCEGYLAKALTRVHGQPVNHDPDPNVAPTN